MSDDKLKDKIVTKPSPKAPLLFRVGAAIAALVVVYLFANPLPYIVALVTGSKLQLAPGSQTGLSSAEKSLWLKQRIGN